MSILFIDKEPDKKVDVSNLSATTDLVSKDVFTPEKLKTSISLEEIKNKVKAMLDKNK